MKKIILSALFAAVVLPHYQPMFENMIVRCDDQGKCHWECEFGVATSTTMVNDNLIVKASGCTAKTVLEPIKIQPWQNNLFIPSGGSQQLNLSTVNSHMDLQ